MMDEREIYRMVRRKLESGGRGNADREPAPPAATARKRKEVPGWVFGAAVLALGMTVGLAIYAGIGEEPLPIDERERAPAAAEPPGEGREYVSDAVKLRFQPSGDEDEEEKNTPGPSSAPPGTGY